MTRRVLALAAALVLTACTSSGTATGRVRTPHRSAESGAGPTSAVPRFAHIVVVVEENHAYSEVIGNPAAPFINGLAESGTLLTRSYGIGHPSEPNYLALFSGSTQGVTDDSCPHAFATRNLGSQLRGHGLRFAGFAQSLPATGYRGCYAGEYARKHAPWTNFTNLPARVGRPMQAFPADYARLPRVSFVIPDLMHDMHDGTIAQADTWLHRHVGGYVRWARMHNSLVVVTWDEDDTSANNHIPGVLAGAHVRRLHYRGRVDHYRLLRTLEAACGLPAIGRAAHRSPITGIWS